MHHQLLFVFLTLASASGFSLWNTFGGFKNFIISFSNVNKPRGQEESFLKIDRLAEKYGYSIESHTVTTEDGYILEVHRLRHRRNSGSAQAVFMMPGIWESSDSWLLQGPDKALAYILADHGYVVWMGNARGNKYTLQHERLDPTSSQFWEYSWEEIGLYDLPAMIDHVLNTTGKGKLYYIGFSQGTTILFVMNSMRPEYNDKIELMFAMAPEAFLGNSQNTLLKLLSPVHSYWRSFVWDSPDKEIFNKITPFVCETIPETCDDFFLYMMGPHHVNKSLWPVILGHVPTGSSTKQIIHYGQLANSGRFCRYDYGIVMNKVKYGQEKPPDYDLEAVTSPVVLFYSEVDWFVSLLDVDLLKARLPKVVAEYCLKQFTHLDFMYADDASSLVYSNIISQIQNQNRSV